jgi:hypothetical protein
MNGHIEVVKILLAAHSLNPTNDFINDTTNQQMTALMIACYKSRVELIKLLLSIPTINIHLKDRGNKTALDLVKGEANEDEIKALLQCELTSLLPSLTFNLHSLCSHCLAHTASLSLSALIPSHSVHHALLPCCVSFFLFLCSFREQ